MIVLILLICILCTYPAPTDALPEREELITAIARESAVTALGLRSRDRRLPEHEAFIAELKRAVAQAAGTSEEKLQAARKRRPDREAERTELNRSILANVAKGLAVVLALLLVRSIVLRVYRARRTPADRRRLELQEKLAAPASALLIIAQEPTGGQPDDLALALVEDRLAAMVNILPRTRSLLPPGAGSEWRDQPILAIRTTTKMEPRVIRKLREAHQGTFETIPYPIKYGLKGHLNWVADASGPTSWCRRLLTRG